VVWYCVQVLVLGYKKKKKAFLFHKAHCVSVRTCTFSSSFSFPPNLSPSKATQSHTFIPCYTIQSTSKFSYRYRRSSVVSHSLRTAKRRTAEAKGWMEGWMDGSLKLIYFTAHSKTVRTKTTTVHSFFFLFSFFFFLLLLPLPLWDVCGCVGWGSYVLVGESIAWKTRLRSRMGRKEGRNVCYEKEREVRRRVFPFLRESRWFWLLCFNFNFFEVCLPVCLSFAAVQCSAVPCPASPFSAAATIFHQN